MYRLTEKETDIESESATEYGISSTQGFCVDAISTDKTAIEMLITELNKGCAQECHLLDIVEDWIEQQNEPYW